MRKVIVWSSWLVIGLSVLVFMVGESTAPPDCDDDWRKCETVKDLIYTSAGSAAQVACKHRAEKRARYGEPEWPSLSFDSYMEDETSLKEGRVRLVETYVKFENQYGAKREVGVLCDYDFETERIVNLKIVR